MIPPTCFFRIIRSCTNIPIIIWWSTLKITELINRYQTFYHTLSLQLESIERILRQTELILNAGDQSSVNIDKHI
jgi:hypothetical protein